LTYPLFINNFTYCCIFASIVFILDIEEIVFIKESRDIPPSCRVHFNAPLCFLTNVYFGFVLLFLFTFNAHKEKKKYQEKEKSAWVAELFEFIIPLCGIVLQRKQLQAFGLYAHIAHNCNEVAVIDVELLNYRRENRAFMVLIFSHCNSCKF